MLWMIFTSDDETAVDVDDADNQSDNSVSIVNLQEHFVPEVD